MAMVERELVGGPADGKVVQVEAGSVGVRFPRTGGDEYYELGTDGKLYHRSVEDLRDLRERSC